ncbi:MAG: hypothetical protein KGJ80_15705, partial [Chloroflexota bacterium]|nr:hypothetical protein [Chloroflexota bacterium]
LDLNGNPPRLVVEDNGRGFEARANGASRGGIGLANIRERARAIGGDVRVESALSGGTRIQVLLLSCAPTPLETVSDAYPVSR